MFSGEVLYLVQNNFKTLSLCISIFSWFLMVSFSSQLVTYMTQMISIPPFDSLETLLDNSDYTVLAQKNSIPYIAFQVGLIINEFSD